MGKKSLKGQKIELKKIKKLKLFLQNTGKKQKTKKTIVFLCYD